MTDKTSKNVALRIPGDLHRQARVRIADLDTSFQQVLMDLLRQWVRGERELKPEQVTAPGGPPVKWDRDYEDLRVIKEAGDDGALEAVQQNLRTFRRLVDMLTGGEPPRLAAPTPLDHDEEGLLRQYRRSSLDKRRKARAQLALVEELGPEVMPSAPKSAGEKAAHKKRA